MSLGDEAISLEMSAVWAALVASSFPIGALVSTFLKFPTRLEADAASFSGGIFIGAIAFSLIDEALKLGSSITMIVGFVIGALVFSFADHFIKKKTEEREKKEEEEKSDKKKTPTDPQKDNSSATINIEGKGTGGKAQSVILGTLADSTPETLFIGVIIALPLHGLMPAAIALFLGNLAAAIEGTKRLYDKGGSRSIVLRRWMYVFGIVFIAGPIGYYLGETLPKSELSIVVGFAAGALLAFVSQELFPKAFERANVHIGLSSAFGFLIAFVLFHQVT
jgi:ZIP family zinc transporter